MEIQKNTIKCRLCDGESKWVFSKTLFENLIVGFYQCEKCQSLETENPYWLDRSYADTTLIPDIRTLQRVMRMKSLVYYLFIILRMSNSDAILDWGGGNGMLVRLLRNMGVDSYLLDAYVKNYYAVGYEHKDGRKYKMITAFQVLEHFNEPAKELNDILKLEPQYFLITTGLYTSQGPNWEYLNAYGRHIFIYSDKARRYIAHRHGYHIITLGDTTLLYKEHLSRFQVRLIKILFSGRLNKLLDVAQIILQTKMSLIEKDRANSLKIIYNEGRVGQANWP